MNILYFLHDFIFGMGVPLDEAIELSLVFFVAGFLLAWKSDCHLACIRFICKFMFLMTVIRIVGSYWVYHHPLREGLWPAIWYFIGTAGVFAASYRTKND